MATEPTPALMAIAALVGAVLLCGYVAAAVYITKKVWAFTGRYQEWTRVLFSTLVLTAFFAPAAIGIGHGAAIGPAWVALVDPGSNRFVIKWAWISLAVTWGTFFAIGVIARSIQKHREKQ